MNTNDNSSPRETLISQFRQIFPVRISLLLIFAVIASNAFGQTLTTLYNFGGFKLDGIAPSSGVIFDNQGNLFGTTGNGGAQRAAGTVFELSPPASKQGSWTETILHRFHGTPDGSIPLARLVMTPTGALLGTSVRGGTQDEGTAYMFTPPATTGKWKEKILHSFGTIPDDIISPDLGLLMQPEGFYGVDNGGANNTGALYLLTPPAHGSTWTQQILFSFAAFQSGDATFPSGEPVRDSNGNFYGVTAQGGVNNLGAIYEISPPAVQGNPWTETVLYSFNGTDGTLPVGPLLLGPGGVLYGTANGGGPSGAGSVFELAPPAASGDPWTFSTLYAFTGGSDGTSPENGVIANSRGRIFGTAGSTVFMLRPPSSPKGSWKEVVLHTFSGPDGLVLTGPLTLSKNVLYGTTAEGGAFGTGTVFQLTLP